MRLGCSHWFGETHSAAEGTASGERKKWFHRHHLVFEQQKKIGPISQLKPAWAKLYAGLLHQLLCIDHILTWEDTKDKLAFRMISADSSF